MSHVSLPKRQLQTGTYQTTDMYFYFFSGSKFLSIVHIHHWHAQSYKSYNSLRVDIDHEDTAFLFLSWCYNHKLSCTFIYLFLGTWLLAVSAFCIEVVVKVIVTVSVYGLFLYDARVREGTWEGLDDAVYYVKAVGNTVEFCFAVFLFFNGGWILFFESGGTIRAVMMVVHAYFNIWCEAKSGWKTFMKRRTAVAKINSLPFATIGE